MVKQEPEAYSWNQFVAEGSTEWTGVRNFQARNSLREMKKGDLVFFYHSVTEKQVVGVARVEQEAFPDKTAVEGDWVAVKLVPLKPFKKPVTLAQMKEDRLLSNIPLIKQSRLSVLPVDPTHAECLLKFGETKI
jgi:predicted RNA-binding protein with PUA-like domain